jgi:tetratricopeptide (TPR) repeat protein
MPLIPILLLAGLLLPAAVSAQMPVQRAAALVEQGRFTEARQILEPHVAANRRDAEAAFQLGRAHLGEGGVDHGVRWLETATRLDAGVARYHAALAGAYFRRLENVGRARQITMAPRIRSALERAVELDPSDVESRMGLMSFYAMAPGVAGGSRTKAREQLAEVRLRNAFRGHLAAAQLATAEPDLLLAERELRDAVRLFPDSTAGPTVLAAFLGRQRRFAEAAQVLEDHLRRRPADRAALYQVGRLGAVSGERLDRAEEALRRYLSGSPGPGEPPHAAAHWRLGMIHEHRGDPARAREAYREALRLDPKHRNAGEALRKLGG